MLEIHLDTEWMVAVEVGGVKSVKNKFNVLRVVYMLRMVKHGMNNLTSRYLIRGRHLGRHQFPKGLTIGGSYRIRFLMAQRII